MFKKEKKNRINVASYPLSCWSKDADSNQKFVLGVSSGTHSEGKTLPRPCCGLTHAHAFYREVPLPHRNLCRSKWDRSLWPPSLCVWQQVRVGLFNPCSPNSWEGYRDGHFPVKISEYFSTILQTGHPSLFYWNGLSSPYCYMALMFKKEKNSPESGRKQVDGCCLKKKEKTLQHIGRTKFYFSQSLFLEKGKRGVRICVSRNSDHETAARSFDSQLA